jgi:hypothetical protein
MGFHTEASAAVLVRVRCEACLHIYEYNKTITTAISDDEPLAKAEKDLAGRLAASIEHRTVHYLGFRKCARCSHFQTWMTQARKENWETLLRISFGSSYMFGAFIMQSALMVLLPPVSVVLWYRFEERIYSWILLKDPGTVSA